MRPRGLNLNIFLSPDWRTGSSRTLKMVKLKTTRTVRKNADCFMWRLPARKKNYFYHLRISALSSAPGGLMLRQNFWAIFRRTYWRGKPARLNSRSGGGKILKLKLSIYKCLIVLYFSYGKIA